MSQAFKLYRKEKEAAETEAMAAEIEERENPTFEVSRTLTYSINVDEDTVDKPIDHFLKQSHIHPNMAGPLLQSNGAVNGHGKDKVDINRTDDQAQRETAPLLDPEEGKKKKPDVPAIPDKPRTLLPLAVYDGFKFLYLVIIWCIMFAVVFVRGGGESSTSLPLPPPSC